MSSASSAPDVTAIHHEGHLQGRGGKRLFWQSWLPEGDRDPNAILVIAHGAAEHSGRYRYVVEKLVPEDFGVYALDHRGHGRSEGARAQLDRMSSVVADLDQLVDLARHEHPGRKVFLLGHSMGGTIAVTYALSHQEKLDGLALSAPLAAIDAAPLPLRILARTLSLVAPGVGILRIEGGAVSRDPQEVRAYENDPLVYRGKLPARTVQELADTIGAFPHSVPDLTLPLLVMQGTADGLVPPAGARLVHDGAGATDKTLKTYEGYFHELFNEPPEEREVPLNDLAGWLRARAG